MALKLSVVKTDCRAYTNSPQLSFLTNDILISAINDAVLRWCDEVRYPPTAANLTLTAGQSYIDISSYRIYDIDSVYYGTDGAQRLDNFVRDDIDQINQQATTASSTTTSPLGYFHDTENNRFYIYGATGQFTSTSDQTVVFNYRRVPTLLTSSDDDTEVSVPDRYCYDLKYFVASYFYNRAGDREKATIEYKKWEKALETAMARFNYTKRDHPKQMRDGMASSREIYKQYYGSDRNKYSNV